MAVPWTGWSSHAGTLVCDWSASAEPFVGALLGFALLGFALLGLALLGFLLTTGLLG